MHKYYQGLLKTHDTFGRELPSKEAGMAEGGLGGRQGAGSANHINCPCYICQYTGKALTCLISNIRV